MNNEVGSPKPIVVPEPRQPKKKRWLVVALVIVGVGLGLSLLVNLALLVVFSVSMIPTIERPYEEKFVTGDKDAKNKIVLVPIKGVILERQELGFFFRKDTVKRVVDQLRQAKKDKDIKAIILEMDTPGGEVTASDKIYNEILKLKKAGKKVIVAMGNLCASGGYYISAAADKIYAHPTTITGSIGVILMTVNYSELFKKIGLKGVAIISKENKDILNPTKPINPKHVELIQKIIDELYERFVEIAIKGRKTKIEDVAKFKDEVADGRIFTAKQALKDKLIDEIGYLDDAIEGAKRLSGITRAKVIKYKKEFSLADIFMAKAKAFGIKPQLNINLINLEEKSPRFMYLWRPEAR